MDALGRGEGLPGAARRGQADLCTFNSICPGRDGDRHGDEDGGAQPNLAFALGSRLAPGAASAFVLAASPALAWPGAQTKAEPGPGPPWG